MTELKLKLSYSDVTKLNLKKEYCSRCYYEARYETDMITINQTRCDACCSHLCNDCMGNYDTCGYCGDDVCWDCVTCEGMWQYKDKLECPRCHEERRYSLTAEDDEDDEDDDKEEEEEVEKESESESEEEEDNPAPTSAERWHNALLSAAEAKAEEDDLADDVTVPLVLPKCEPRIKAVRIFAGADDIKNYYAEKRGEPCVAKPEDLKRFREVIDLVSGDDEESKRAKLN